MVTVEEEKNGTENMPCSPIIKRENRWDGILSPVKADT